MDIIHTVFSVTALLAGSVVFFITKGTPIHRKVGATYVVSMLGLIFTSFFIYDFFGGFGMFHILSLVSLGTMAIGMYYPLFARKNKEWVIGHYFWMNYSYVGLLMAGGSHLFGVVPDWPVWLRMILFWGAPYLIGTILIFRQRKRIVEKVWRSWGIPLDG